ncbi:hypothetical protein C8J57DRAFT_1051377 [Mycena rebaudengoi]|nr:hypothetical protein C8J57DRAFT_1051377 [Mycena rebaudengoi]
MFTLLFFVPLLAFGCPTPPRAGLSTEVIFNSSAGLFLENIAVRPCSSLLLTSVASPTLFTLNPKAAVPTLDPVFTFPNSTGLTGIVEFRPDVYAVVASQLNLTTVRALPDTVTIWSVDLTSGAAPVVKKITSLPPLNDSLINGLSSIPGRPDLILASESVGGSVVEINTLTGASRIAIQDESMTPGNAETPFILGINGLKVRDGVLFFTNTLRSTFSRVPLDLRGASVKAAGAIQLLARLEAGFPDDFAFDGEGRAWVASILPDGLNLLRPMPRMVALEQTNLARNASDIKSPTSLAFGRGNSVEQKTAYVLTQTGQVVRVDTRGI